MSCVLSFFADISSGWVNLATLVGAVAGVALSLLAIWLTVRIGNEGTVLSKAIESNTLAIKEQAEAIQGQTAAIQKQTEALHKHTKILRIDNLRTWYEISRETERHLYWAFRWRFETYDRIGGQIEARNGDGRVSLGHCDLLIQGFSNAADHIGFENREPEFYTARVTNILRNNGQEFPFNEDEIVACFDRDGTDLMISKGVDPWTLEPKYFFNIVSLGHQEGRSGVPTARNARTFPRIKNS